MTVPRYESYRDCGVDWLGVVPSHWDVKSLKRGLRLVTERTDRRSWAVGLENIESWSGRLVETDSDFEGEGVGFEAGDILYGKLRPYLSKVYVTERHGEAVGDFHVLRSEKTVLPKFAAYQLRTREVVSQLNGSTFGARMPRVGWEFMGGLPLAFPPLEEQAAIAAFLDRETGKIDAMVEAQQRLIELLKEKRQAVISHAVTKGLDPAAPMKDSGVEWLGKVPAHWEVSQSRRLFAVRSEPALPEDQMLTASQKYGVLLQSDFVEREGRRVVEVIMGKDSLRHVEPDDFIISMRSFQGGLEWSRLRGCTSFHYVMVTPIKWVHAAFFAYLFKCLPYIQALRSTTDLIRDGQELRYSHFAKVPLPVIPVEEQGEIAEFLDQEIGKYDELLSQSERFIGLLQDRRAALISAAVTGKIDVRGLAMERAEAA